MIPTSNQLASRAESLGVLVPLVTGEDSLKKTKQVYRGKYFLLSRTK